MSLFSFAFEFHRPLLNIGVTRNVNSIFINEILLNNSVAFYFHFDTYMHIVDIIVSEKGVWKNVSVLN